MSLPPIKSTNKYIMPIGTRNSNYKFKTSFNIKILNPLIPLYSKNARLIIENKINKAQEVMSSFPPSSLQKSKFIISRLSPSLSPKPTKKTHQNTYLKKKYVEFLNKDKVPDYSINFHKEVNSIINDSPNRKTFVNHSIDPYSEDQAPELKKIMKLSLPEVFVEDHNEIHLSSRYTDFVSRNHVSKQERPSNKDKKSGNKNVYKHNFHKSLQTDPNSFEFDNWEFDYDA
jgi:hypothetical protein